VVCVTSGGELLQIAERESLPLVRLPGGYQPRYALYLMLVALLLLLQAMSAIPDQETTIDSIRELLALRGDEFSRKGNGALETARNIYGSVPVIYSAAGFTNGVGLRFKSQLNENSKVHAFHNIIPEMNHNEITGWQYVDGKEDPFTCLTIIDRDYPEPILTRFSVTRELLAGRNVPVIELTGDRADLPGRIMDMVYTSDWISYYLALIHGRDPGNIDFIEAVKKRI
jgi:glucose/mannose-6-phosphate isomerase